MLVCPFSVLLLDRLTSGFGWYSADARGKQSKTAIKHQTIPCRIKPKLCQANGKRKERGAKCSWAVLPVCPRSPLTLLDWGHGCGRESFYTPDWIKARLPGLRPHQWLANVFLPQTAYIPDHIDSLLLTNILNVTWKLTRGWCASDVYICVYLFAAALKLIYS